MMNEIIKCVPFYIVSNYIKWITTSWTYCMVYTAPIKEKIKLINDYLSIFSLWFGVFLSCKHGCPKKLQFAAYGQFVLFYIFTYFSSLILQTIPSHPHTISLFSSLFVRSSFCLFVRVTVVCILTVLCTVFPLYVMTGIFSFEDLFLLSVVFLTDNLQTQM